MQKEQTKKLIMDITTGLLIAGVLVVGYFAFKKNDVSVQNIIVPTTETADQVLAVGAQVSGTVQNLKDLKNAVEQSSAVFATPAFTNLQDFTTAIPSEPVGRANPFVPTTWKLSQKSK